MRGVRALYKRLDSRYGPQGWWPIIDLTTGKSAYRGKAPVNDAERFEIAIGAILTQNVAWTNAEKGLLALKEAGLLDSTTLTAASRETIAAHIRPSGYYNQKAQRIIDFSRWIADAQGGSFDSLRKAGMKAREMLLARRGIGPETADSILLYALAVPVFVVDAYTRRLLGRLGYSEAEMKYDELRHAIEDDFAGTVYENRQFHALIVEHAKEHCRKTPRCDGCPLREECHFERTAERLK